MLSAGHHFLWKSHVLAAVLIHGTSGGVSSLSAHPFRPLDMALSDPFLEGRSCGFRWARLNARRMSSRPLAEGSGWLFRRFASFWKPRFSGFDVQRY